MNNKAKCLAKVEDAFKAAEAHYNVAIPRVAVKFTNGMTQTAGKAISTQKWSTGKWKGKEIRLSNKLLTLNGDEFIGRTPGHEAAHIIAITLFQEDGRGHGRKWQEVMGVIGQDAQRCHNMETVKSKSFRYVATCGTVVELSAQRHSKIQKRGIVYTLGNTKGKLNRSGYSPIGSPVKIVETTKPKAPTKRASRGGTSKASMLRDAARPMKDKGVSLEEILANDTIIEMISKCCGLPNGNVRSGLRFHWSKI